VDERLDTGELDIARHAGIEAEQAVDLVLVEHAVDAVVGLGLAGVGFEHRRPVGGDAVALARCIGVPVLGQLVLFARSRHYCTRISLNRMPSICAGKIATLMRRRSSSLSR